MNAWHFVGNSLRDGRPIPADGETLVHEGEIAMCKSGLHASERVIEAMRYAPGTMLCRVRCEDIAEYDSTKLVCRQRTIEWRMDIEELLEQFARECALNVLHLCNAPKTVAKYLTTGDKSLRAKAHTDLINHEEAKSEGYRNTNLSYAYRAIYGATHPVASKTTAVYLAYGAIYSAAVALKGHEYEHKYDEYDIRLTEKVMTLHRKLAEKSEREA